MTRFLNQPDSIPKPAQINFSSGKIQFLLQHKSIPTPGASRTALTVAMQFSINQSRKMIEITIKSAVKISHSGVIISHSGV